MKLVVIAIVAALLTGCAPTPAAPRRTHVASPAFASDEEAFAAAKVAYQRYMDASQDTARSGGSSVSSLKRLTTAREWKSELKQLAYYTTNRFRSSGSAVVTNVVLRSTAHLDRRARIGIYSCVDVSGVQILDASGIEVTPPERPPRLAFEVDLVAKQIGSRHLLIDGSDRWFGPGVC